MKLLLQALWFLIPAGGANMAPVLIRRFLPKWNYPIDAEKTFLGKRILGDHKTVRGFISGVLSSTLLFEIQRIAFSHSMWFREISIIDYENESIGLGILMGMGALGGDLLKSFIKRQLDIPPGKSWFPSDQIDWIVGALFIGSFYATLSLALIVVTIGLALILSLGVKVLGYWMHVNETPI